MPYTLYTGIKAFLFFFKKYIGLINKFYEYTIFSIPQKIWCIYKIIYSRPPVSINVFQIKHIHVFLNTALPALETTEVFVLFCRKNEHVVSKRTTTKLLVFFLSVLYLSFKINGSNKSALL